ncbi:MAG: 23S rRNA (guanosine(2251)-2'-O)-methyltransferase RlmB, partial [Bacilli bacterium]|nr:23S rRNA (guanosine(2251)-2'-O)-methyltransferase RlmB [Bacilli bacterium]
ISRLVLENSDFVVKIPMLGHVNSLNVSVATGVLLSNIRSSFK